MLINRPIYLKTADCPSARPRHSSRLVGINRDVPGVNACVPDYSYILLYIGDFFEVLHSPCYKG